MKNRIELILGLIIIGVTLDFGGVLPLAYSLMEIGVFALVLVILVWQTRRGSIDLPLPVWPLLFGGFVALQLVPLPTDWVAKLDPARVLPSAVMAMTATHGSFLTLSVYPHATVLSLIKFFAYVAAFLLAAYLFDSHQRKSMLVTILIFLGLFEAAYGLVQYLTGWQKIFTYRKVNYVNCATGTFINHNHFAGFLELASPFVVASTFYYFQIWQQGRRRGRAGSEATASAGFRVLFFVALLLVEIVAVIMSRSRAGIVATLFSLMFLVLLAQFKTRRKIWMAGLGAFVLAAVGYGLWIGLNPVLSRFEVLQGGIQYLEAEGRLRAWQATLGAFHDFPVFGTGLGTFRTIFPRYQTYMVTYTFTHAHNDYLEVLEETGWIGTLLLWVPIFWLWIKMVRSFFTDTRRYRPAVTLGCIGGTLGLLIHSVADFNLHIPANAFVLAVVLGIGYKAACVERKAERIQQPSESPPAVAGGVPRKSGVV